ncbi:MAG: hypothetical protein OEY66_07160 [Gammaproteobacteria bacterium]|nr:hypothetical protein [Gammaproteobacteria bacterium]
MYQRKDKDGKVITERATVQPTPEQAQKQKFQRIADDNKQREAFLKSRESKPAAAEPAPVKSAITHKPAATV